MTRCKARTKARKRCRNAGVIEGRCRIHAPKEEPVDPVDRGPNEEALIRTLSALGPEEDPDAARYEMLRSLARAVDVMPTRAALWAEYREGLADLMKDSADADRSFDEARAALENASATEMGDRKDR